VAMNASSSHVVHFNIDLSRRWDHPSRVCEDEAEHEDRHSVSDLSHVTCPSCREHVATIGRAYQQARRHKLIDW
jgi:hypothetical protein